MEDEGDILFKQTTVHPLIRAFAERIALEAQELAKKHSDWTVESVIFDINILIPSIMPRILHTRISGYYIAMREEKANAPPEVLAGGKAMQGQSAQLVAPRYKAKKKEYDAKADEERRDRATATLQSVKEFHKGLMKTLRKSAIQLAEQKVSVVIMAVSPEPSVDTCYFHSEGYARRFMNLIEDAKVSWIEFQKVCMGDQLLRKVATLDMQKKTPKDARSQDVRKKLLILSRKADKTQKAPLIEIIPCQEGRLVSMLKSRQICVKTPSSGEGWPQDLGEIEVLLQSNRDSDILKVFSSIT